MDILEDRAACYRTGTQTDLLLFLLIEVYMLADSRTHTCCSAFHSNNSIHVLCNGFGRGVFPSSTSLSICVVLLHMEDVEDKITSKETHEERSSNTSDIQEKREDHLDLATQISRHQKAHLYGRVGNGTCEDYRRQRNGEQEKTYF